MPVTAEAGGEEESVAQYRGMIIIEWPPPAGAGPYGAMLGRMVTITDAMTRKPVKTCTAADITVHADAQALVTADLTLLTDADGEPIFDGAPVASDDGREILTGTFPFLVAEMRVREA